MEMSASNFWSMGLDGRHLLVGPTVDGSKREIE